MVTEHAKICRDYTLRATPRSSTTGSPDSAELTLFASGGPAVMPTMTTSPLAFWRTNGDVPVEPLYDRGAADVLADISAWAYSDCKTLVDELHHRGIVDPGTTCHEISVRNDAMFVVATAFFMRRNHVGVLCFRGTEPSNVINFLTDANVNVKQFLTMGRVHGAFHRNVRAIWDDIADHIWRAINDTDDGNQLHALYITGHSLGAAMAVIAAAIIFGDERFASWRPLVRGVYTYGQPMVGDPEFAESCDARFGKLVFRHIYDHDLVPRMPPWTTGPFRHFGAEYVGDASGWYPRSKPVRQAATALWSVPIGAAAFVVKQLPLLSWVRLPFSIDDHSPNSYLEAFRAAREA